MTISNRMKRHFLPHIASSLALLAAALPALAAPTDLPVGGTVAAGSATINTVGSAMTIATGSTRTVMSWNSFSIGSAAQVSFNQPSAGSAVLNRVTGPDISQLMGTLNSNGSVFLANPNGVIMGAGAQFNLPSITINTSTTTPSDANFISGSTAGFITPGASGGNIFADSLIVPGDVSLAAGGTITIINVVSIGGSATINTFTPSCGLLCSINTQPILSGNVTLSVGSSPINITNSPSAISNWSAFSISPGQTTNFAQPSDSRAVTNRIESGIPAPSATTNEVSSPTTPTKTTLTLSGQSLQSGSGGGPVLNLSSASTKRLTDRGQVNVAGGQVQITPQGVSEVTSSLVNTGGLTNATTMTANGSIVSIGL